MKRLIALLLCITCLVSLVACANPYPPVDSTDDERRTVMTFTFEGERYEVKYELYRAFALLYRDAMSEGEGDTWEDPDRLAALHARVSEQIYEIYATLALCKKHGIDLYSRDMNKQVEDYIRASVEGDSYFKGYGSYEAYLAALKESYLNYATADLLYRYSLGQQALYTYYQGTYDHITDTYNDAALTFTDADVDDFYNKDDTIRVMLIYLSAQVYDDEEAVLVRSVLQTQLGEGGVDALAAWLLRHTSTTEQVTKGEMLSPYTLDDLTYAEVTAAALSLSVGQMSELVRVSGDDVNGYYLIYRMDKTTEYLAQNRDAVRETCMLDAIGRHFHAAKDALRTSRTDAPLLSQLNIATMTMD